MAFNPWGAISTAAAGGGLLPTVASLFHESGAGKASKKEYERQKEFAQNALQWRVADATAAGLHPLAALGMPLASYSSAIGGGGSGDSGLANEVSSMGANLSRAMTGGNGANEAAFQSLQLENMQLQNDKLRAEIALNTQPGSFGGPLFPPSFGVSPSQPNKNKYYQDHYGEGADVLTYPDMVYDMGRVPGGIFNPNTRSSYVSPRIDAAITEAVARGWATLGQWYTPGGWNKYWSQ